ncbi:hypothetical protein E2C01_013282 [Portunus trituberculatus]|uniref:Uncharacterized protein n=1 Tax=Portunus trituberculatus TaxID=210409 RepID=A0A5B7DFU5_PORTR|nr:hypothetical protein [Portunus trituberculatus]
MKHRPLRCPYCRTYHRGTVLCPSDLPLHEELIAKLAEEKEGHEQGNADDPLETNQLNVLKLREDVKKASIDGHSLWTLLPAQGGQTRHSRVSLFSNRLHLHALQDGEPPSGPQTVPTIPSLLTAENWMSAALSGWCLDKMATAADTFHSICGAQNVLLTHDSDLQYIENCMTA